MMNDKRNDSINELSFRAGLSKWIAGMYWSILAFLVIMMIGIPQLADMELFEKVLFLSLFSLMLLVFIFILFKAYKIKFTIAHTHIIVSGIFRKNRIDISDIKSIQKTPMPFGFRLFGASFLGGWYFLQGIGKAGVAMSNFEDGVLITTKQDKHYVITPGKPLEFIKIVRRKML